MTSESREPHAPGLMKVTFLLDQGAWHGSATETLWAEPVGLDQYRLRNTPFYAFDVSFMDIVRAVERDGALVFMSVVARGGHSTYRILLSPGREADFESHWTPLRERGCTYEQGPKPLLAVDVPPQSNIFEVYRHLEAGEAAGVWGFEEGHCGHHVESGSDRPS